MTNKRRSVKGVWREVKTADRLLIAAIFIVALVLLWLAAVLRDTVTGKDQSGKVVTIHPQNQILLTIAVTFLSSSFLAVLADVISKNAYKRATEKSFVKPVTDSVKVITEFKNDLEANTKFVEKNSSDTLGQITIAAESIREHAKQSIDRLNFEWERSVEASKSGVVQIHSAADIDRGIVLLRQHMRSEQRLIGLSNGLGFWVRHCQKELITRLDGGFETIFVLRERVLPPEMASDDIRSRFTIESVGRLLELTASTGACVQFLATDSHPYSAILSDNSALISPYVLGESRQATPLLEFENVEGERKSFYQRTRLGLEELACPKSVHTGNCWNLRDFIRDEVVKLPNGKKRQAIQLWLDVEPSFILPTCSNCLN